MVTNFLSVNAKIHDAKLPEDFEQVYTEVDGMFEGMTHTQPLHECLLRYVEQFPDISTVLLPAYLPADLPKSLSLIDKFSHLTFIKASSCEIMHKCSNGYFPDDNIYNLSAEDTGEIYMVLVEFVPIDATFIVTATPIED